jgi:hypothetical protein
VIVYGYSLSPKQSAILIKGLFWSVKNNHIDFFNNLLQKTQPLTIDRHQISRIAETEENFISVALIDKKYDFIKSMIDSNFVRKYQQFFKIANVNKIYDYFFEENDCLHFMKFNIFPTAEQIVVYVEDEYKLIEKNIKSKNSENLKIIIKNYIYGTYYIHKSIESILTYAKDHKDIDLLTLTLENHLKKRLSTFPEFLSKKLITDSLSVLKEYNPELSDVFLKDYTDSWAKEDLRNSWLLKGYTELSVADRKKLFNTNSREKEGLQESSSQKGWCVIS